MASCPSLGVVFALFSFFARLCSRSFFFIFLVLELEALGLLLVSVAMQIWENRHQKTQSPRDQRPFNQRIYTLMLSRCLLNIPSPRFLFDGRCFVCSSMVKSV